MSESGRKGKNKLQTRTGYEDEGTTRRKKEGMQATPDGGKKRSKADDATEEKGKTRDKASRDVP